jgi:hypothetical protein
METAKGDEMKAAALLISNQTASHAEDNKSSGGWLMSSVSHVSNRDMGHPALYGFLSCKASRSP